MGLLPLELREAREQGQPGRICRSSARPHSSLRQAARGTPSVTEGKGWSSTPAGRP